MKKIALLNINNTIEVNQNVIWTSGIIHAYLRKNVLPAVNNDNARKKKVQCLHLYPSDLFLIFFYVYYIPNLNRSSHLEFFQ